MRETTSGGENAEDRIGLDDVEHARCGIDGERLGLAQIDEARDVVDVAVGQHDGLDRACAKAAVAGGERGRRADLLSQIGGSIEQHPVLAVAAHGERGLRQRLELRLVASDRGTVPAIAVPLRKPAAGTGPEDPHDHVARALRK